MFYLLIDMRFCPVFGQVRRLNFESNCPKCAPGHKFKKIRARSRRPDLKGAPILKPHAWRRTPLLALGGALLRSVNFVNCGSSEHRFPPSCGP